jgi:hypothetical protein
MVAVALKVQVVVAFHSLQVAAVVEAPAATLVPPVLTAPPALSLSLSGN